jgi:hypothetical protein
MMGGSGSFVYETPQTLKPRLVAACVSEETASIWQEHYQMLLLMIADLNGIKGTA